MLLAIALLSTLVERPRQIVDTIYSPMESG
jgi:hypothetical protein